MSTEAARKDRPSGLRRPSRGPGIARFQALLAATEALLRDANPDQIGLYQIAEQAGVPPASVYHFFPTKEAAYQALAEWYLDGLLRTHAQPIPASELTSWQDLTRIDMGRAMTFYNDHPPMLKILYGGYGGVEARNIDILITDQMAGAAYERLNTVFQVPFHSSFASRTQVSLAILDAIWTISVRRHGVITPEYFDEGYRAVLAHRRLYLPEYLEPQPMLSQAFARGESVTLPFIQGEIGSMPTRSEGGPS